MGLASGCPRDEIGVEPSAASTGDRDSDHIEHQGGHPGSREIVAPCPDGGDTLARLRLNVQLTALRGSSPFNAEVVDRRVALP